MGRTLHRPCPQCNRQVTWPETPTYPFCSERCQLIDLGAWASGDYRLPGEPISAEDLQQYNAAPDEDETSL